MTDSAALLRKVYDLVQNNQWEDYFAMLDPEVELLESPNLPYGGTYRGVEAVVGILGRIGEQIDQNTVEVLALTGGGDHAVALVRVRSRAGDDMLISEHWTFRDGKVLAIQPFYWDTSVVR